jgi:acetyl esterase/lipase
VSRVPGDRLLRVGALEALTTLDVFRPFSRKGPLSPLVFFSTWPVSELPAQAAAFQVALTAALARPQDLRSRRGVAGLALTAASVAGLLGVRRAAERTPGELELALVDGLGPHYRREIRHPRWPPEQAAHGRSPGATRSLLIRRSFAHGKDIAYGPHGRHNLLDVWRHQDLPKNAKAPVLLQVPGGGWVVGNKQAQAYPLMGHLAERGWVCVAMSYRLSPKATWPDFLIDVKRAIGWIRANIAEHGGDPDFIAITGGSAGGHLSSLAALTANNPAYQPGFEDVDTSVKAAVPLYGVYDWVDDSRTGNSGLPRMLERVVVKAKLADDPQAYRAASPLLQVHAGAPPMFVLHGTNDSMAPVEQARLFVERLRATSKAPVAYAELPLAQHAFDFFGSLRAAATAQAIERFLGVIYGREADVD